MIESVTVYEFYNVERIIGVGAYGIVCSALNLLTHEKVAIKKVINFFKNIR